MAAIVGNSADGIIGVGLDGVISDWNRGAAALFGYREAQAVADHRAGQLGIDVEDHLDVLVALVAGEHHGQVLHQRLQLEGGHFQDQLAGLDLRVVEDFVEQAEQRGGRRAGLVQVV
ncbi:PAS domain-containing protein, partial [Pseudomonas aeruginosa]